MLMIGSLDDRLLRANTALSKSRLSKALELYTGVLYDSCPGHICALLNRALVYLRLGYPELAVTDAYRAAQICHDARVAGRLGDHQRELKRAMSSYLRTEKWLIHAGEFWTRKPCCFTGEGWLENELAKICISPEDNRLPGKGGKKFGVPWFALEVKAVYRLCGALWRCGNGAISDGMGLAADVLSFADVSRGLSAEEYKSFRVLGDSIMRDAIAALADEPERANDIMRSRGTMVNRVIYPWDTHTPPLATYEGAEQPQMFAEGAAVGCTVGYVDPALDIPGSFRPVAASDAYADRLVLLGQGNFKVTTSAFDWNTQVCYCDHCACAMVFPEDGVGSSGASPMLTRTNLTCSEQGPISTAFYRGLENTSVMSDSEADDIPLDLQARAPTPRNAMRTSEDAMELYRLSRNRKPVGHDGIGDDADDDGAAATMDSSSATTPTRRRKYVKGPESGSLPWYAGSSTSHRSYKPAKGFRVCIICRRAIYCSEECLAAASGYHSNICRRSIESDIREHYDRAAINETRYPAATKAGALYVPPARSCLQQLLFVRALATTGHTDTHLLELPQLAYLGSDFHVAPSITPSPTRLTNITTAYKDPDPPPASARTLRWTFTENVVRPILYLQQMGIGPGESLDEYDGWVINAVMARIEQGMRVQRGASAARFFSQKGRFERQVSCNDGAGAADEVRDAQKAGRQDVWVGCVYPALRMTAIAKERGGRRAKMAVRDGPSSEGDAKVAARPCERTVGTPEPDALEVATAMQTPWPGQDESSAAG